LAKRRNYEAPDSVMFFILLPVVPQAPFSDIIGISQCSLKPVKDVIVNIVLMFLLVLRRSSTSSVPLDRMVLLLTIQ
jgi:hypothetical protein